MLASERMASDPREVWGDLATSAFVRSSHLFKSLDEEACQDLLKLAQVQTYSAGETLVSEGSAGEEFFLVRDGTAALSAQREGQALELGHLDRGGFFGEHRLLGGDIHPATVVALTEVAVVHFPAPMVAALAERFPKLGQLLQAVAAARRKELAARGG
jgi:CRP-like cAMP-binding protein